MALLEKRLFVGNLPANVSQSEVKKKLSRFGDVQSVEMKQRNDSEGNVLSSFAFVDIAAKANELDNCFQYFENEPWHKQKVKVQLAKESFLDRLKREQKCLKKPNESSMVTEKKSPVSGISLGRTKELQSPSDSYRREKTLCISKDETAVKKKSRVSDEGVKSQMKKYSPKSKSYFANDDSEILGNRTLDWDREDSRLKGLPKFGGTKLIVGENDSELTDGRCDIRPHEHKNSHGIGDKSSSPDDFNSLTRHSFIKGKNSRGEVGDVCDRETEDVPMKNKNLPMFCGTTTLISAERCLKEDVSLCNSAHCKVIKQDVEYVSVVSNSKKKSLQLATDGLGGGRDPQGQYSNDKDSRSEAKFKKVNLVNSVTPPTSLEKQTSHQERNPEKSKKDLISERKRMNALEERKKTFDLQKEAVKQALSSVDSKNRNNKKIIFDEDEEDMVPEIDGDEKMSNTHKDKTQLKLFMDDSDDENIKNLESAEFKIKPQFEGRQGQKLLAIQSRYGHDSRFNLDERFLESDEEDSTEEVPAKEEDLNAEKDHQLNILTEMLGVDVTSRKLKKNKTEKRDSFQMVRFDPSNPEHSKYLVKEEDLKNAAEEEGEKKGKKREAEADSGKSSPKKKSKKEEEVDEEPVPVVMERFYKVSDKLKESLRKRTATLGQEEEDLRNQGGSGGFSLLQKFGSPPSDNEEEEVEYSTKAITRNRNEWEKNPFRYDSSEEEDEVESNKPSKEKPVKSDAGTSEEPSQAMKGLLETFYFQENDPRLQEGLNFFGIKKTFAEMQEGFHERRTDLKMIIKAKVRNNKRRNRPLKKKLGGARKHKKQMAGFGLKR